MTINTPAINRIYDRLEAGRMLRAGRFARGDLNRWIRLSRPLPGPERADLRFLARVAADALEPEHPVPEGVCLTCVGNGVVTIAVGGPDSFGNYDTDEILCPECDGSGQERPDPETYDLSDGGGR